MTFSYCDDYNWPSGQAAGKVLAQCPELKALYLSPKRYHVNGNIEVKYDSVDFAVAAKLVNNEMIDAAHIRENLQKIDQLRQLQSLVELAELLDDVACLSSDYRFYMNIGGNYHCLKFLNFQQVTVNLNLSTDLLFKVATVSDYFSMNSEGRMSFVGQVREALETASAEMKSFNEIVRSEIIKDASRKHVGKTYYSGNLSAFSRYTN